jgi:hypothetical protein
MLHSYLYAIRAYKVTCQVVGGSVPGLRTFLPLQATSANERPP